MNDEFDETNPVLDSGFGLDPHVLPQFDLMVEQGRITREFADQVIAERRAAGLPMTPGELQPRPAPLVTDFSWLSKFGGPEIRSYSTTSGKIDIDGDSWSWRVYGTDHTNFTLHFHENDIHVGWISLSQSFDKQSVCWEHVSIIDRVPKRNPLEGEDISTVKAWGSAQSISEAIAHAKAWTFEPFELGGFTWYKTSDTSWKAETKGETREVSYSESIHRGENEKWRWEGRSEELEPILSIIGAYEVSGYAATRDEAMLAAVSVVVRFKGAAMALVGDLEAFEAGKAAGRSELLKQIAGMR